MKQYRTTILKISLSFGERTMMKIVFHLRTGNFHFEQATTPQIPTANDTTPIAIAPPITIDVY